MTTNNYVAPNHIVFMFPLLFTSAIASVVYFLSDSEKVKKWSVITTIGAFVALCALFLYGMYYQQGKPISQEQILIIYLAGSRSRMPQPDALLTPEDPHTPEDPSTLTVLPHASKIDGFEPLLLISNRKL